MRIAVNTRFLLKDKLEGIGVFTHEVLSRLTKWHPEHEFIFCFDRSYSQEFIYNSNVKPLAIFPQARHPILFYWWFELSLPNTFAKYKPDVFLSTDGFLSLAAQVPSIPVMHDLAFIHYPNDITKLQNAFYRYYFPKYAHKAARILTVSEYSKNDIVKQYEVSKDKIDVVFNGAKDIYKPISAAEQAQIRYELTQDIPYFVYVGAMHQRKNIDNLLKSFDLYREKGGQYKLVLVGRKAWGTTEMEACYANMKHRQHVVFTGRVSDERLHQILASASCLTYLSYFEGFGIPILEAMKCQVPVITSNITSMPEVAGDAAILVNPFSIDEIADAMMMAEKDTDKMKSLVAAANIQADKFSWDKTAEKVWKSISIVYQNKFK